MRRACFRILAVVTIALMGARGQAADAPPGFPTFQMQEIDTGLTIGYAVIAADINGDKKPDIVVVDKHKVVWYENPTWKKRVILDGKTAPDNVCITALDIDGGGDLELVVGAAWKPFDTRTPGTLQWLKRGKTLEDEWTMYPIPCEEPTVHRVRAIDIDGDGKPEVVHVPLIGREATKEANWMNGRPVRVMAYKVPADPTKPENWKPMVLSEELHVCHNFAPVPASGGDNIIITAYEGVFNLAHTKPGTPWNATKLGVGNQDNPKSNRGASEIKMGSLANRIGVIATIEPWHGNQVVTYSEPRPGESIWNRHVIDDQLRWGHAVTFADLDGDHVDELIIGVRDDPNAKIGDTFTEKKGVRVYKCIDGKGAKWERFLLENGGVAVEDLTAADFDGDGRIDIVAVGRATGNARIYWNKGVEKK